jgi:hypothetical protein
VTSADYTVSKTPAAVIDRIRAHFTGGHAVALIINPAIVDNAIDSTIGNAILYRHLVMLSSDFQLQAGNYLADVMTWGSTKRIAFKKGSSVQPSSALSPPT